MVLNIVSFIIVVYDVNLYMLIMSHNGWFPSNTYSVSEFVTLNSNTAFIKMNIVCLYFM